MWLVQNLLVIPVKTTTRSSPPPWKPSISPRAFTRNQKTQTTGGTFVQTNWNFNKVSSIAEVYVKQMYRSGVCDVSSACLSTGASQNVVYQNEDGEWVTDLAYYSSFEKEVDSNAPEDIGQFQAENFVPSGTYPVLCFADAQMLLPKCFLSHCELLNDLVCFSCRWCYEKDTEGSRRIWERASIYAGLEKLLFFLTLLNICLAKNQRHSKRFLSKAVCWL